ncbi:MAG: tRNA (guanosine(37)-N1)-methyltransferase TrmD [Patescibacteria group bacterium]
MQFHIITIFPESMSSYFETSILGKAQRDKQIKINFYNPRDFTEGGKLKLDLPAGRQEGKISPRSLSQVDDKPYGGGAGMVLKAEPILKVVESIKKAIGKSKLKILILSAKGKQFDQVTSLKYAKNYKHIILITGRYEGIDERVRLALRAEEVSIGPYVLTDGEVAAAVMISSIARLIPGVIKLESLEEESFLSSMIKNEENGNLEYPHYTRPEVVTFGGKNYRVPKILLSGNHKKIKEWREKKKSI